MPLKFFKKTNKMKSVDKQIVMLGIICLTILELFALSMKINGTMFSLVVGVIALAIGVILPKPKMLK